MRKAATLTSDEFNIKHVRRKTLTDWERVKREAVADAPVVYDPLCDPCDPNDAAAVSAHWDTAKIIRGPGRPKSETAKKLLPVRYDLDIIAAFKSTGKGWQTRMNDALRTYLKEHPLR